MRVADGESVAHRAACVHRERLVLLSGSGGKATCQAWHVTSVATGKNEQERKIDHESKLWVVSL